MAEITIDKLKKVYDEALIDLEKIVQDWNTEWQRTCESFEKLEVERLEFFKSNLSNCANLMIGCLENEVQACERVHAEALKVNVSQDLAEFVNNNKSSDTAPCKLYLSIKLSTKQAYSCYFSTYGVYQAACLS